MLLETLRSQRFIKVFQDYNHDYHYKQKHAHKNKLVVAKKVIAMQPFLFSVVLILFTFIIKQTEAYIITLDAHAEECFFESAVASTKLGFTFEVIEGGFYDIDVSIYDPDGNQIYQDPKASSGKYTIEANKDGHYKYCFSNKMSTVTPKVVMFNIETARHVQHKLSGEKDQEKMNDMMKELSTSLISVKHELEYLSVRDRIHRQINENTNSRVITWAWIELGLVFGVCIIQIFYLKRFFEVRRVI